VKSKEKRNQSSGSGGTQSPKGKKKKKKKKRVSKIVSNDESPSRKSVKRKIAVNKPKSPR
jgi:hypothetical protein